MDFGIATPNPGNVIAASVLLPVLCTVTVGLRFYTRYVQKSRVLLDDWLTLPALVCIPSACGEKARSSMISSPQILTIGMGVASVIGKWTECAGILPFK